MNFSINIFRLKLGTRLWIFSLILFLAGIWSLTLYVTYVMQEDTQKLLFEQQQSTAALLAAEIDQELGSRLSSLATVAGRIRPTVLGNTRALQAELEQRPLLLTLFNAGCFVTRLDGTPVADIPISANRLGLNVSDRDYMTAALKEGKASVGTVVIGKSLKKPVFSIAAPIRDENGRVLGALVGVTDLGKPNFLDEITTNRYGKSGSYLIIARQQRQIIASTDKSRVLEILPPSGVNKFIDQAVQGFDSSGVTVNPRGVEVLASVKNIAKAHWYVDVQISTEEAFAPINSMKRRMLLVAFVLTLSMCGLTWRLIRKQQLNKFMELLVEERTNELHRSRSIELFRSEILELLADDVPLAKVLEAIVRGVEEINQTMLCSILLLDSKRMHLGNGIAPSLPGFYNAAIEGLEIGMGVGSCGTAAFTGERVIVEDIATHPYWASFKELATSAGLGACWSQPVISSSNQVLGTFAIYHHEARSPDDHEIATIEQAANLASIAIDKSIVSQALSASEIRFRSFVENANDLIYSLSPAGIITYVAPNVEQLLGYRSDELIGTSFAPLIHEDELPACILFLQQVIESGEKMSGLEYRILHKNGSWLWFVSNASPVRDPVTEEISFYGIGHDITKRKLMEKELFHKQNLLEDMNRVLEEHLVSEQQKSSELADLLKRLQHSEDVYHSLVETSQDLIWRCDAEGRYIFLNLAWEHILGYELDEMLGKKHSDFQTDEEAELYRKEFDRLQHGESIEQFETTFNGRSGNAIRLVFNAINVMDELDEFVGASGTAHNITLRKQIENKLQESEEKHRILLQESGDAIFALTAEGRYTFVNRAFSKGIGKPTEEIIGKTLWDVFSKEEAEKRFSALSSAFRKGEVVSIEVSIPHADGTSYHLTTINPIKDTDGKVNTAICSSKNITELKNSEKRLSELTDRLMEQSRELRLFNELLEQRIYERTQELQASQSRINELSEKSHTVFWEVDAHGRYTYINHVSDLLFGYRPEEMIGRMYFYDLFPENECEAFKKATFAAFESMEQLNNIETRIQTKDNRTIWISTNAIPMLDDDGSLLGYRGSDTDVTENLKLKEQLLQSQKMEAVGQLAGGLAHDFNNILSIINGYCCLLQMDIEEDERVKDSMDRILAASARASELTHSMLAFSRTQVMKPENQNLNGIVSKTAAFVEKIIGDNIKFKTVTNEAALPVFVDEGQIEQVLINLSNNARDAMPSGGELIITTDSISMDGSFISAHGFGKPGRYAIITVSDSGTGMDEATRKKIFEPFFTTKAVDKGTGLGLAMVYGIVKQHNGYVDVSSAPGQGASFMIYLPVVESKTTASAMKTADNLSASAGTETILIAEDNADLLEFMRNLLSKLGYRVISAVDGQEAVDKFREYADLIHLIIMDMIMPNKSGKAAYDEIKQIKPDVKALFSSGYSARIVQRQGELGENAEFIPKPVQPAELMKKVREMLDRQNC